MSENKQVIITGLPRSGTSVVAGIVSILGVDMGNVDTVTTDKHPTGTYEDHDISNQNHGMTSLFGEYAHPKPSIVEPTRENIERVTDLISRKSEGKPLWGCKDPRISFMMELWAMSAENPYFIVTTRERESYIDAIRRYATMQDPTEYVDMVTEMFEDQLKKLQRTPRMIVRFEQVTKDPLTVARNIAKFLGIKNVPEDLISNFVITR